MLYVLFFFFFLPHQWQYWILNPPTTRELHGSWMFLSTSCSLSVRGWEIGRQWEVREWTSWALRFLKVWERSVLSPQPGRGAIQTNQYCCSLLSGCLRDGQAQLFLLCISSFGPQRTSAGTSPASSIFTNKTQQVLSTDPGSAQSPWELKASSLAEFHSSYSHIYLTMSSQQEARPWTKILLTSRNM